MSTSPVQSGSSQGIVSLISSSIWRQWKVHPIRTVFAVGVIGVVIYVVMQRLGNIGSISRDINKGPDNGLDYVISLSNRVSTKPFRTLLGRCANEKELPQFLGNQYVQGILHMNPEQIFGRELFSRDLPIEVDFVYRGSVRKVAQLSSSESHNLFLSNLPYKEDMAFRFKVGNETKEVPVKIGHVRGLYEVHVNRGSLSVEGVPLKEREAEHEMIHALGAKKLDQAVAYTLEENGIKPERAYSNKWYFSNSTDAYQVCILRFAGASSLEEDYNIEVAVPFALGPRDNIEFTHRDLIQMWQEAYFQAKGSQPLLMIVNIIGLQQIVYRRV